VAFLELFPGLQGTIIASLILLPIFMLMWLITLKLYTRRKKKSYLTLFFALLFTLINHAGSIWHSSTASDFVKMEVVGNGIAALGSCAFILLILGFYQLYQNTTKQLDWAFYGTCIITVIVTLLNTWIAAGLLLVFILTVIVLFGKKVGTDNKFRWALSTFFITKCLEIWMKFKGLDEQPWEAFLIKIMPVLSYSIMFFILLERVIEVMQKSYLSSITDALTGLFNRRHFYESLQKYVHNKHPVSVIFSDIDNFKKLNDTKGHKAGDDVLKQVAIIIKEEVDGIGMAGRYGGEEIVAFVRDSNVEMKQLTERIRVRIEKETNPGVTASIGFSTWEYGTSHDELIKQADQAMYEAKTTGKNKVIRYIKST